MKTHSSLATTRRLGVWLGSIVALLLVSFSARAQTTQPCEGPNFGLMEDAWAKGSVITVNVSPDFTLAEYWAIREGISAWANAGGSQVTFVFVRQEGSVWGQANTLQVNREPLFPVETDPNDKTKYWVPRADTERLFVLGSPLQCAQINIRTGLSETLNGLRNLVSHETGHTFGLGNCTGCPPGSTAMRHGGAAGPTPCDQQAIKDGAGYEGSPPNGPPDPRTPEGPLPRPQPSEPCWTRDCVVTQICWFEEWTREGRSEVQCTEPELYCELVPGWCPTGGGEVDASGSACGQMTRADECQFGSVCCYDHLLYPPSDVPTCESRGLFTDLTVCEADAEEPCRQVSLQIAGCLSSTCPSRTCWQSTAPEEPSQSCGEIGGDYCSQGGAVLPGYDNLGVTWDCNPCLRSTTCQSTGCNPGECGWQTDGCGDEIWCGDCGPSCGEQGGDYCSQTGSCPGGYASIGNTFDCGPCCQSLPSCGEIGGDYCSQNGSCPDGYDSRGPSFDCATCCEARPCSSSGCPAGSCGWQTDNCGNSVYCGQCAPSCGAMGGDYCSQSNACPSGYTSLGPSSDCGRCCKSPPSCGAMGGNYCSQTGSCPSGFTSLGQSNDCSPCCVSN